MSHLTVAELIKLLQKQDPNSIVFVNENKGGDRVPLSDIWERSKRTIIKEKGGPTIEVPDEDVKEFMIESHMDKYDIIPNKRVLYLE